jgi:RimJ/RimL family protein N-acetyltransferase
MEKDISLTDGTITLLPYQESDIGSLYEAARESIPEMSMWMPWCHPDYTIQESREFIKSQPEKWEKGTDYNFTGLYQGGCGINRIQSDWGIANLGYWVRTSQTKKGIATAAALLLARFAFTKLKLNRVEIIIAINNRASLRVAEKVGATKEGVLRNGLIVNGKPSEAVMFSLIPTDFRN